MAQDIVPNVGDVFNFFFCLGRYMLHDENKRIT